MSNYVEECRKILLNYVELCRKMSCRMLSMSKDVVSKKVDVEYCRCRMMSKKVDVVFCRKVSNAVEMSNSDEL